MGDAAPARTAGETPFGVALGRLRDSPLRRRSGRGYHRQLGAWSRRAGSRRLVRRARCRPGSLQRVEPVYNDSGRWLRDGQMKSGTRLLVNDERIPLYGGYWMGEYLLYPKGDLAGLAMPGSVAAKPHEAFAARAKDRNAVIANGTREDDHIPRPRLRTPDGTTVGDKADTCGCDIQAISFAFLHDLGITRHDLHASFIRRRAHRHRDDAASLPQGRLHDGHGRQQGRAALAAGGRRPDRHRQAGPHGGPPRPRPSRRYAGERPAAPLPGSPE